ncbi:MAG: hypothetical protein KIS91_09175 [Anaerolineae bacterium]|nr:hypothetical protein [Anaerolineae bacterium]
MNTAEISASARTGASPTRLGLKRLSGDHVLTLLEILTVCLWAWISTQAWRDMDPLRVPAGREVLGAIQINTLWGLVTQCGACAFWFGGVMGGFPAFAEPTGSQLHPIVAVATLIWGPLNGAKVALSAAIVIAGLAQWWLGWVLRLGRVARVWAALIAVSGAHIVGRMELGNFSLVMSTATCALLFAPLIAVSQSPKRIWVVILGMVGGLSLLSGHLYIQIALMFALPAVVFLLPWDRQAIGPVLARYVVAAVIAFLLAAPFLVPFAHFMPQLAKDADVKFDAAQPFAYIPLNLVIDDLKFYQSEALGKKPFPAHYMNFIGWIPVLLALWGLSGLRDRSTRRVTAFLAAFALLVLWAASAGPQTLITERLPGSPLASLLAGARYTAFMQGIAVPAILGLAGIGLHRILLLDWPRLNLSAGMTNRDTSTGKSLAVDLRWLMVVPLVVAIAQARTFSQTWIGIQPMLTEIGPVLAALKTPDAQWVNTPYGEQAWTLPALESGLKLGRSAYWTWHWRDRKDPEPVREATRQDPPPGMQLTSVVSGIKISAAPNREYATVVDKGGARSVCTAHAVGGDIDVQCDTPNGGVLTTKEYNWTGWRGEVNGQPAPLASGQWLAIEVPPGASSISFRYRPWDVPLGLALAGLGLVFIGLIVWRDQAQRKALIESPAAPAAPSAG